MAVGGIGALGFQNFQQYGVYNTNRPDRNSLNKIEALPEDGTQNAGVDFSGIAGQREDQNANPVRPGQTPDFGGVLDMQMAMGRQNAARIFAENAPEVAAAANQTNQAAEQAQAQLEQQAEQTMEQQATDPTVQGVSEA